MRLHHFAEKSMIALLLSIIFLKASELVQWRTTDIFQLLFFFIDFGFQSFLKWLYSLEFSFAYQGYLYKMERRKITLVKVRKVGSKII